MSTHSEHNLPEIAFIVGMGRSGTTLLTNMFNSHPNIISTPENEFVLFSYASYLKKTFSNENTLRSFINLFNYKFSKIVSIWEPSSDLKTDIQTLDKKNYANVCKLVYLNYPLANKNKQDAQYVVDKNPIYSLHIPKLNRIYPDAKYVVLVRDFRDNAVSRKKYGNVNDSIFKLAASWNYFYKKITSDLSKHKIDHIIIKYEDLASNPEATLKRICLYMNIDYSENMLHFQGLIGQTKDYVNVKQQLSNEVYTRIAEMHSNLAKDVNTNRINAFENELTKEEISILNLCCKEYGLKFGYLSKDKANSHDIKLIWRLQFLLSTLKVSTYYTLKNLYFKLPVSIRLLFLKKMKA